MKLEEKYKACEEFFNTICEILSETYEVVGSCNKDISRYLIPNGTIEDLTYSSKPKASLRISDHWNWYSNTQKCPNEKYVQCFSKDFPWTKQRKAPGKASSPIKAISVCVFGSDNTYHCVFGEKFDRKSKEWYWVETPIDQVMSMLKEV